MRINATHGFTRLMAGFFSATIFASSCTTPAGQNRLTEEEQKEGWVLLFDGKTTEGWHLYNEGKTASTWQVKDGELYCNPNDIHIKHGDLISDKEFQNFDLKFEWKIPEKGNSGVFINVVERPDLNTAWRSGPEYQLLEVTHQDYPNLSKRSGCLYGFGPTLTPVDPNPTGQWNQSEIKQVNGKVQFYLNGVMAVEKDFNSQAWKDSVAVSGFKSFPEFGMHTKGHIALQEWAKGVSFRNIRIKELK